MFDQNPNQDALFKTPLRILTNLSRMNQSHFPERQLAFSYVNDDEGLLDFFSKCLSSNLLILNTDPTRLMLACVLKLLTAMRCKIVSVDLIVRTPGAKAARIKTLVQKLLFKRVHRFILHFKDLRGCERFYGIGPDRAVFVPFKVNALESIQRRLAVEAPGDGEYVMCAGRTSVT